MVVRRSIGVIAYVEPPLRVLLLRRPESRAAGWQSVSGRVETSDAHTTAPPSFTGEATSEIATLANACIRELHEETGLGAPLTLIDLELETQIEGYDGVTYHQRHFAARYSAVVEPPHTPEHEEAKWLDADDAVGTMTWAADREALGRLRALVDARHHKA